MKYFTEEVYRGWYLDPSDGDPDAAAIDEANSAYHRRLQEIRAVVSDETLALTQLASVDDSLIDQVTHDRERRELCLTLLSGDLQVGYYYLVLRYLGATISDVDERILAALARSSRKGAGYGNDLWVHELDWVNGLIEHRFLFHPCVSFKICCERLEWSRQDTLKRSLTPMKERFPGGPPSAKIAPVM
jgi:hypothetical protein